MAERIILTNQAANHIQAYIDYQNIVGNADGGKLMSEKEFEAFKKNQANNIQNKVWATWRNSKMMDCKNIGPSSMCFCGHRYKEHEFMNPKNKKVLCKSAKCSCPCFSHVPVFGSADFKCLCKHSYTEHDPISKKCTKGQCGCNNRFQSSYTCSCGQKFNEHQTYIENRQERQALGKPVDEMPSFQQLVDGADGYEAYIDQLGGKAPAIGYQQQKALGQQQQQQQIVDPRKQKLANLNNKFAPLPKDQLDQFVEEQAPAQNLLQLFNTPHIYGMTSIAPKRIKH